MKAASDLYKKASEAAASGAEKEVVLLSKINLAKCVVHDHGSPSSNASLKSLAQEADSVGLKYLSTEATLTLAESLLNDRQAGAARKEIDKALKISEKLGLQAFLARSHYLLARTMEADKGNAADAASHYATARRTLEAIRQESGTDGILKRADLSAISTKSAQ